MKANSKFWIMIFLKSGGMGKNIPNLSEINIGLLYDLRRVISLHFYTQFQEIKPDIELIFLYTTF